MNEAGHTAGFGAAQLLRLLDLTSLGDEDSERSVRELCAMAVTPYGRVAAVCVWPRFVSLACDQLRGTGVRVATVANFPAGGDDPARARSEVEAAVAAGAHELDVVMPWRALLDDQVALAARVVNACRDACRGLPMKVIIESGALEDPAAVRRATRLAIECGADFVKTSTGKHGPGASLEAAGHMLEVIAEQGGATGFKASGGIRTVADARAYADLAARTLSAAWVRPAHFRIGASSLLGELLEACLGEDAA